MSMEYRYQLELRVCENLRVRYCQGSVGSVRYCCQGSVRSVRYCCQGSVRSVRYCCQGECGKCEVLLSRGVWEVRGTGVSGRSAIMECQCKS